MDGSNSSAYSANSRLPRTVFTVKLSRTRWTSLIRQKDTTKRTPFFLYQILVECLLLFCDCVVRLE
eukprot:m.63665 g.63665  ORF g.63665 m.63665 type:complete len:66 (+) comp35180_c1_seq2:152-349(+)